MRLDKLTIGSNKAPTDGVDSHRFKNLKNVSIDFDQDHWVTVVIGWNGTGKSNVLEALAIIFRDLVAKRRTPAFAFQLTYRVGLGECLRQVHIDADPDRAMDPYSIRVGDYREIEKARLIREKLGLGEGDGTPPQGEPDAIANLSHPGASSGSVSGVGPTGTRALVLRTGNNAFCAGWPAFTLAQ